MESQGATECFLAKMYMPFKEISKIADADDNSSFYVIGAWYLYYIAS